MGDRGVDLRPKIAAPPKKGSHAEIMARAKAAQEMVKDKGRPGEIKHKPIEKGASKMSGRSAGGASWGSKSNRSGLGGDDKDVKSRRLSEKVEKTGGFTATAKPKPGANREGKAATTLPVEPVKKIKKAATATTGYTGTARPAKANPRANISSAAAARRDSTPSSRLPPQPSRGYEKPGRRYSYAHEDEEEEEDYESDVSSDMEARREDLEEEEEMALRIAKREDQEEEKRLKREAEEKRKRLAARGGR